jgi:hypothetical protein
MIKTALSASLIALAVLAPAASAAPEPKPKPVKESKAAVLDAKTAKYCAELAAVKPDKKGVVTYTKDQLAFLATFDCPVERPADCPDEIKQAKLDKTVKAYVAVGSASARGEWPEWLKQSYRQECSLEQFTKGTGETKPEKPFDPGVIGSDKRVGSPS